MEFISLLVAIAVMIWGLVICRHFGSKLNLFHPVPLIGILVVLTGSVISSEFWSLRFGPIPITFDRLLVGLLVCVFLIRYITHVEDRRQVNRLDIALICMICALTFSTVSHDMTFLNNLPPSRLLFFYLMPLAVYGVVRNGRLGTNDLKLISVSFIVLSIYLALTAIAETRSWSGLVFPKYIMTSETSEFLGRGRGPYLNPVSNGLFMITGFCCVLMWWPSADRVRRVFIVATALLFCVGVYCTLTRSVWLGLIVACGCFIWFPASQRQKLVMMVWAMFALIALLPVFGEKVFSFKRDKEVTQNQMEKSAQLRPLFAIVAVNMFKDRPFLGCGFGQYAQAKYPYLKDPYSGKPLTTTRTLMQHNIFLAYLTETGLLGLSSLLLVMGMIVRACLVIWFNEELPLWPRMFGLLLLTYLCCYMVNGLFHDTSIIPMANMLLFFLAGIANNIVSGQWQFDREARLAEAQAKPPLESSHSLMGTT
jgi:O-antigen ligase